MPEVVEEKCITVAEVKKLLEELEGEVELNTIQAITLEYARRFSKTEGSKARELVERLVKEKDLPEEIAVQIVNVMPESVEELRTILAPLTKTISTEELEDVLRMLEGYRE